MQRLTILPLHTGKAPQWLFGRMVRLGDLISEVVMDECSSDGLVEARHNRIDCM